MSLTSSKSLKLTERTEPPRLKFSNRKMIKIKIYIHIRTFTNVQYNTKYTPALLKPYVASSC